MVVLVSGFRVFFMWYKCQAEILGKKLPCLGKNMTTL